MLPAKVDAAEPNGTDGYVEEQASHSVTLLASALTRHPPEL